MTCDERLEALLNRAGQTISDLPEGYAGMDRYCNTVTAARRWFAHENAHLVDETDRISFEMIPLTQYILHLTDIIDRMELALENVLETEAIPLVPLAKWLTWYAFPPTLCVGGERADEMRERAEAEWIEFLRRMDWSEVDDETD